jgi:hypothetical protein
MKNALKITEKNDFSTALLVREFRRPYFSKQPDPFTTGLPRTPETDCVTPFLGDLATLPERVAGLSRFFFAD